MALRACKECGNAYSNSAKRCPHCGAQNPIQKWGQIILLLIVVFVCVEVYFTCNSSTKETNKTNRNYAAAPAQPAFVLDIRPDSQKKFEEICVKYAAEYGKGENELQKSRTRNNRKNELQKLGTRTATNWIGTLDSLDTNSDGKAIVVIKLNNNVKICTWNNAFSDIGSNTLIPMDSALYKKLEVMKDGKNGKAGDKVKFSGNFFIGYDKDYYQELSMSENGAMQDAEFLIRFSDVTKLKSAPFATENINLREGPSAEAAIIEALKGGTGVKLLGNPESNGWVKASVNGKEGYVNSKYLTY